MSKEIELDCPSGLKVRLRGIKGKDLDGLRDKRRVATGEAISKLLDDCTLEVLEKGPYATAGTPDWSWKKALVGDRVRAIIGLRAATSGQMFGFRVRCGDPDCRSWIDWELDLMELPMKALPAESRERFVAGNRFSTVVADTEVTFRLNTGEDQARSIRLAEQLAAQKRRAKEAGEKDVSSGQTLLGIASRIIEVAGHDEVTEFLADLELGEVTSLLKAMDKVDCGIETTIDVPCEKCGEVGRSELPLDATFFTRSQ